MPQIIKFEDIPVNDLKYEYISADVMFLEPKIPFHSRITKQHMSERDGVVYGYQEWEDGHKLFLARKEHGSDAATYVKTNYEMQQISR